MQPPPRWHRPRSDARVTLEVTRAQARALHDLVEMRLASMIKVDREDVSTHAMLIALRAALQPKDSGG